MRRNFIRSTSLAFLIVLSLVLTFLILTVNDSPLEKEDTQQSAVQNVNINNLDIPIFAPSQVVYHGSQGMRMLNSQQVLAFEKDKNLAEEQLSNFQHLNDKMTGLDFYDLVQSQPTIVLCFDQALPFSSHTPLIGNLNEEVRGKFYNFMLFSTQHPDRVQFYNSESQDLYQAEARGTYLSQLKQRVESGKLADRPVSMHQFGNTPIYLPQDSVKVARQDYLLERIPNTIYVDKLFDDPSEVNVRYLTHSIRYNDLYSELSIDEDYNLLVYSRQGVGDHKEGMANSLKNSFEVLNQYENWSHGLHYNGLDSAVLTVSFRRYLDGYPIFADRGEDLVEMGVYNDDLSYLQLNLTVAQTPIDAQQEDRQSILMNGQDLANRLINSQLNQNMLKNIRIGYDWQYSEESDRVVHFIPRWFINYDNQWYSLEDLLKNEE